MTWILFSPEWSVLPLSSSCCFLLDKGENWKILCSLSSSLLFEAFSLMFKLLNSSWSPPCVPFRLFLWGSSAVLLLASSSNACLLALSFDFLRGVLSMIAGSGTFYSSSGFLLLKVCSENWAREFFWTCYFLVLRPWYAISFVSSSMGKMLSGILLWTGASVFFYCYIGISLSFLL